MDSSQKQTKIPQDSEVEFPGRRSFLTMLLGIGSALIGGLLAVPLLRFTLHPLFSKTTETAWSEVGKSEELLAATGPVKRLVQIDQRDGWRKLVSEKAVYVIKGDDKKLRVFSTICSHLGCSISWREGQNQFVCPCHVGTFGPDGKLISGPPPRSMDELESKIEDGVLKVRYQYFRQLVSTKEVLA
jgi:menaquinol-cytochrome c reductase iron-sulfur subunit